MNKTKIGNDYGDIWEDGGGLGMLMGARNGSGNIGGGILGEIRYSSGSPICSTLIVKKPNRVNRLRVNLGSRLRY